MSFIVQIRALFLVKENTINNYAGVIIRKCGMIILNLSTLCVCCFRKEEIVFLLKTLVVREQWSSETKDFVFEVSVCFNYPHSIHFLLFFIFILFLNFTILVLPNIEMNPPQVYLCSPS